MIQRIFIPGSHWVYFKLYAGEKTADDLLIKIIVPILKKLQKKEYLQKWFFIRYSDPDFHLRVRMLVKDTQHIGEIINLFYQKILKLNYGQLLWKVQLDTYKRELERYSRNLIEEAESVFYADSECILSIIRMMNANENYRWMIALKLIDELLNDFHLNTEEKQKLMENLSKSFKVEFGFNEHNTKQFNIKFRTNKGMIESVLDNDLHEKEFISLFQPMKKRSKELIPIVEKIKKFSEDYKVNELLKSFLHMMLNRLFRSENRMHEMILYDFMFRYYNSKIAKKKYN